MNRPAPEFAIREPDASWAPCTAELNQQLGSALRALTGTPGSVLAHDDAGEPHVLSWQAGHVLYLALLAMDSRLRPAGCYKPRADEIYAILASGPLHQDGVQELRKIFQLGARRPWLVR